MEQFLAGALIGALVVAVVATPLVAPWPIRLRWLVASQLADPIFGLAPFPLQVMREVRVVDVLARADVIEVTLAEVPGSRRRSLVTNACSPGLVARLEGWCAVGEPLLLLVDEHGDAQLGGSDTTVTGFRNVSEHV